MNHTKIIVSLLIGFSALMQVNASELQNPEFNMPKYSLINGHNVNVLSGTLHYVIKDLSIGYGNLKLDHSIQISGRDLAGKDNYYYGYKDKYLGGIKTNYHTHQPQANKFFKVVQVIDHESSNDFTIEGGKFTSMTDKKLTLERVSSTSVVLTKPDGTRVHFVTNGTVSTNPTVDNMPTMSMEKIEHPNGLVITIHKASKTLFSPIRSVNSNNGLQLKYVYEHHNRPLEASKRGATNNPQVKADSVNFSYQFPKKIIALNNAVEVCSITTLNCSPTNSWPTVSYEWPDGMPRAMYVGNSVFKIRDGYGVTTEFHHTAFDVDPHGADWFEPRIINVKNSQGLDIFYHYKNVLDARCTTLGSGQCTFLTFPGYREKGILSYSLNNGVRLNYDNLIGGGIPIRTGINGPSDTYMTYSGYRTIEQVKFTNQYVGNALLRAPFEINNWDAKYTFERSFENKLLKHESKLNGTSKEYEYDSLGRVKTIWGAGKKSISYPYMYNGICSSYKFCHKPASISNYTLLGDQAKYTIYTYHPNSGNVASITQPKNKQNKVAKQVFQYLQYYARYKNSVDTMVNASTPIWLLSSQFFCQNSNVSGTNCSNQDKVTTTYHYGSGSGSSNLFLQGKTVTSQADNSSRTYCYKYDSLGNQIEQSAPKSGITNCNAGREY